MDEHWERYLEDTEEDLYSPSETEELGYDNVSGGGYEELLINQDYNLDSPLNETIKNSLLKLLKNGIHPDHHYNKIMENAKIITSYLTSDEIARLKPSHSFYQFFVSQVSVKTHPVSSSLSLPKKIDVGNICSMLLNIYEGIFYISKGSINKEKVEDCIGLVKGDDSKYTILRSLLNRWIVWDGVVKIRNKFSSKNMKELDDTIDVIVKDTKDNYVKVQHKVNSGIRGREDMREIYMGGNFYYISGTGLLLTHEEVLMIKDTIFGRFACLLVATFDLSGKYSGCLTDKMVTVLTQGDEIITKLGNKGYDHIKNLEPLCIKQWINIARTGHYDDLYKNFSEHVLAQLNGMQNGRSNLSRIYREVESISNQEDIGMIFGMFRLWGHPHIKEEEGLAKIKKLVREEIEVDENYARLLGSDLVQICLKDHFDRTGTWGVDIEEIKRGDHILKPFILDKVWPTQIFLQKNKIDWYDLPVTKIYDVPADINLSTLYSDKSHSCGREDLYKHWRNNKREPLISKKVLRTLLETENLDVLKFLEKIAEEGISPDQLIIGLKDKERELKISGRFFTLMSWEIRDYIVLTEYLIKKFFMPHFSGITMADGLTKIIKKILQLTKGQGETNKDLVTIANHVDFEKWNNLQRHNGVKFVFNVMDRLLGFKGPVIERTHQIFEKVLVYYPSRVDKLRLLKDRITGVISIDEHHSNYGWNGQKGGFEGVRQKGWTIVGALLILRESKKLKAKVGLLAQGDNQIILTNIKVPRGLKKEDELFSREVKLVNERVLKGFYDGVKKLGLRINKDETYSSESFIIYGKVPVIRGILINLEGKKWARSTCVSNDQLPTSGNIMGTIGTTAIGSQQYENCFKNSIFFYTVIGTLSLGVSFLQNPILRSYRSTYEELDQDDLVYWLYLDRSIGGYTGNAPSRFLIRQFPDPISESLAFWRRMRNCREFKKVSNIGYNPIIVRKKNIRKLIENPSGLNIVSGNNIEMILKGEIRKSLIAERNKIKNQLIRGALNYETLTRGPVENFLEGISPCFPKFLSEFLGGTELGLADTIVGLIQNSRTIRNLFKTRFSYRTQSLIIKSEKITIGKTAEFCKSYVFRFGNDLICSSTRADQLRRISWNQSIIGMTIPHPLDYMELVSIIPNGVNYVTCGRSTDFRSVNIRGPMKPYLGSRTSETTSVINPWDKEIKNPLSKKAWDLTRCIDWFVKRDSNLFISIINNLNWITKGDNITLSGTVILRTGNPVHRFGTDRVSSGGFIGHSPNPASYFYISAETLGDIRKENYDFMYQSTMLVIQAWSAGNIYMKVKNFYGIWSCPACLRRVEDGLFLESKGIYNPNFYHKEFGVGRSIHYDIKEVFNNFSDRVPIITENTKLPDMDNIIGFNIGLTLSLRLINKITGELEASLFPVNILKSLKGQGFLTGFVDGIRCGAIGSLFKRFQKHRTMDIRFVMYGSINNCFNSILLNEQASSIFDLSNLRRSLINISKYIPPSFPTTREDMNILIGKGLRNLNSKRRLIETWRYIRNNNIILFSDTINDLSILSLDICLLSMDKIEDEGKQESLKKTLWSNKDYYISVLNDDKILRFPRRIPKNIFRTPEELRHFYKSRSLPSFKEVGYQWGKEYVFDADVINIFVKKSHQTSSGNSKQAKLTPELSMIEKCLERKNYMMRGLRMARLPTGSHYKIRSVVNQLSDLNPDFIISMGDGSGGCGSALLRIFKNSLILHNSLTEVDSLGGGTLPQIPSGYLVLNSIDIDRCINHQDYWKHPSDMRNHETWEYFFSSIPYHTRDLLIFNDAEGLRREDLEMINRHMRGFFTRFIHDKRTAKVTLIQKIYYHTLLEGYLPDLLLDQSSTIKLIRSHAASLNTDECYLYVVWDNCKLSRPMDLSLTDVSMTDIMELHHKVFSDEWKIHFLNNIDIEKLLAGLPCEIINDFLGDFSDLCLDSKIPPMEIMKYRSETIKFNPEEFFFSINRFLLREGKKVISDYKTRLNPTHSEVLKFLSIYLGAIMAKGVRDTGSETIRKVEDIFQHGLEIRWNIIRVKDDLFKISFKKKSASHKCHIPGWSFSELSPRWMRAMLMVLKSEHICILITLFEKLSLHIGKSQIESCARLEMTEGEDLVEEWGYMGEL